jgi:hypothetical protein
MAFTFTKTHEFVAGDRRITMGTFTSAGGSTGGDIYTGLQKVDGMKLTHKGSAVVATHPVVNETFPVADPVTIVTAANGVGYWLAFGH